jgi:hypothetical protein
LFVCAETVQNRKIICRLLTSYDQTFDVLKCRQTSVNCCKIVNQNFARIKFKNIYHMRGWFPIFQFCADETMQSFEIFARRRTSPRTANIPVWNTYCLLVFQFSSAWNINTSQHFNVILVRTDISSQHKEVFFYFFFQAERKQTP